MRRRRPRWPWFLLTAVVIVVCAGFGPRLLRSGLESDPWPFDLHTVGVACYDDPAWVCGGIQVPLDRSTPGSGSINVQFRVLPRRLTTQSSVGTVVVVNGGPGDSSMNQHASARRIFAPLLADHDLLLVDNRGSGASDTIDCPHLQESFSPTAIADCRALLGPKVDDYSTVAAVDDLEAVLTRIHTRAVDLYGESYGSFFAQAFALRYPQHLRRLVLDGALPIDPDPWRRDSLPTGLAALQTTCRADPTCRASGDPKVLVGKALARLRVGTPRRQVSPGAADLAFLLRNAGRAGSAYRELPAALRAYLAADYRPLYRLLDESSGGAAGSTSLSATSDSVGLQIADDCADEPQPFDLHASLAVQKRQLEESYKRVAAAASAFLPFTPREGLQYEDACLGWPAPTQITPRELGRNFPDVPTLVLEGGSDTVTPPRGARSVANEFRGARYVEVPFVGHITALNDGSGCAAGIAVRFLVTLDVDTRCLAHLVSPPAVDAFPKTFVDEAPIVPIDSRSGEGLSTNDRRTVAVARDAISDVLWRWARLGEAKESGLRGGTAASVSAGAPGDYRLDLDAFRWTSDTTISGYINVGFHLDRGVDSLTAAFDVTTPVGHSHLAIRSKHILGPAPVETIAGRLDGHSVNLSADAKLGL